MKPAFSGELTFYNITHGEQIEIAIEPKAVFEWSNAVVYPKEIAKEMGDNYKTEYEFPDSTKGEAPINLSELFDPLKDAIGDEADKIGLDKAELYVYIDSSGNFLEQPGTTLTLTVTYTDQTNDSPVFHDHENKLSWDSSSGSSDGSQAPSFDENSNTFNGVLEEQFDVVDLQDIINARPDDFRLTATVDLADEATIDRGEDYSFYISPQIVIKLPLRFRVEKENPSDSDAYLNLDNLLSDSDDPDDDLFGRDSAEDQEDLFEFLDNLNLFIDYKNNLGMNGMQLIVTPQSTGSPLPPFDIKSPTGTITTRLSREDIEWPFMPKLQLKIPDPDGSSGQGGLLELKRQDKDIPSFSITSMSVTAGMVIDKTY
jgi:hypothetical protein